jgi:hypothetical protein
MSRNNTKVVGPKRGAIVNEESSGPVRYVRAKRESYLNGMLVGVGEVTVWPEGVETLGPNLEEYFPAGEPKQDDDE